MVRFITLGVLFVSASLSASAQAPGVDKPAGASLPQYELNIRLMPEAHKMEVEGTLRLPPADSNRESLGLRLSEVMRDLHVEVVEPPGAGPGDLKKRTTSEWAIEPARPIATGESVLLRFSYSGGEQIAVVFYLGPDGSFVSGVNQAWYPQVGDRLRGRGALNFSVPPGYSVYSVGRNGTTASEAARGNFRFEVTDPVRFSFGAGRYSVISRSGSVPVSVYMLHPRDNAEKYATGCFNILSLLVQEFGAYPHPSFAIVEVPDDPAEKAGFSGASVEGFIFANTRSLDSDFNTAYYGHELGHQWWGNLVGFRGSKGASMLSEGMAQFGSLLAVEALEGDAAAEHYRRTGYPGYSQWQDGLGYLKLAAAGIDHRLVDITGATLSHQLSDSKGFLVWDALSRAIGPGQFSEVLRSVTQQYQYKSISWEEFTRMVEAGARTDLKWFFDQWFERTGAPDWKLTWKQAGPALHGAITQTAPYYRASVEIEAGGKHNQKLIRTVEVNGPETKFDWPIDFEVESVELDPHFHLLHWTPQYRAEATALINWTRGIDMLANNKLEEALRQFNDGLQQVPSRDVYGVRFELEYGIARVLIKQTKMEEAREHLKLALASPSQRAEDLPWVYAALATVASALHDGNTFRSAVESAKAADRAAGGRTGAVESINRLQAPEPPR